MATPEAEATEPESGFAGVGGGRRMGTGTYAADLDDVHIFVRKHVAMSQVRSFDASFWLVL